jgi:UDP-N-acetylglucosamine 2-epimerase (non-hydrolysing)
MKVLIVVGARPNFMKAAPIIAAIRAHNERAAKEATSSPARAIQHVLVHTGQHYDQAMSDSFFADLNLPKPDVHLGVGSGTHASQTAEIMKKFEDVLLREKPDVLIVVGDVNSTVGCALVAAKVVLDTSGARPLIAHVEAGLRSFDRSMPEEINRIVTDHLSDFLFVTEESGLRNLAVEGVPEAKVHLVGNTMIDSVIAFKEKAESSTVLSRLGLLQRKHPSQESNSTRPYALLTLHRPSNVDNRGTFQNLLNGLAELIREYPVVFPVHPRTSSRIAEFNLGDSIAVANPRSTSNGDSGAVAGPGVLLTEPLGYLDFLCLMKHAAVVVTDSGGIQEETTCLGIPCVTVRENTERPVTVEKGTNVIAGTDSRRIQEAIREQLQRTGPKNMPRHWDGHAAARIIDILVAACDERAAATARQTAGVHQ